MSEGRAVFEQIVRQVKTLAQEQHVPGVVLGMLYKGEMLVEGVGVTSIANPLPVTADTYFQIGSITKTYTALAIRMLAEAGKLALDDPVIRHVPDLRLRDAAVRESVTIEQLLTHTAGWDGDIFTYTGWGDDALAKYVALLADAPQVVPNGSHLSYNNAAFSLAGRVIEVVTGETYEAALRRMIFDPLGLEHSLFFAHDVLVERFAVGHVTGPDDQRLVARPWAIPRGSNPAGGIVCTVPDMLRYGQFMLAGGKNADGTALLAQDSFASLVAPREDAGITMGKVALSWFTAETSAGRLITHGGGTNGQISDLVVMLDAGLVFAIVTNSDRGSVITSAATKAVLHDLLGVALPEAQPVETTGVDLDAYVMAFQRPMMDFDIQRTGPGELTGRLKAHYGLGEHPPDFPDFSLAYAGENRLVVTDTHFKGTEIVLIPNTDGRIGFARFGGRLYVRADNQTNSAKPD